MHDRRENVKGPTIDSSPAPKFAQDAPRERLYGCLALCDVEPVRDVLFKPLLLFPAILAGNAFHLVGRQLAVQKIQQSPHDG